MHYGLEFAFYSSPQEVQEAIKKLAKANRAIKITEAEKKRLRQQIQDRQRICRRKEKARREGYSK